MRRKTFFQTNILWQLLCFAFLLLFLLSAGVGVRLLFGIVSANIGFDISNSIVYALIMFLYFTGVALIFLEFLALERNNIHLDSEKIYMKKDWNTKKNRIQYYSEVRYSDISDIDIIWTNKDSQGKTIRSAMMSSYVEKPYLAITIHNGKTINFFIMYISKKDVVRLVNEIKVRMINVGNATEIPNNEVLLSKLKKKIYLVA